MSEDWTTTIRRAAIYLADRVVHAVHWPDSLGGRWICDHADLWIWKEFKVTFPPQEERLAKPGDQK